MRKVTYIAHHGIKGQQWGVRNGPPYPLDKETHEEVVENKNNKKTIYNENVQEHKRKRKEFDDKYEPELKAAWKKYKKSRFNRKEAKENLDAYNILKKEIEDRRVKLDAEYEKAEIQAFRDYMIEKSKLKRFKDWYRNASDEEILKDIKSKEETKKMFTTMAVVTGVGLAGYMVIKHTTIVDTLKNKALAGFDKRLVETYLPDIKLSPEGKAMQDSLRKNLQTFDMILDKDCPIHRFHGSSDFDLSKIEDGDPLYTTFTKHDDLVYKAYLASRTGEGAFHINMKTTKEVRVAGEQTLEKIFDKLWTDPSLNYKKELAVSLYGKFGASTGVLSYNPDSDAWCDRVINSIGKSVGRLNPKSGYDQNFAAAMYSIVLRGNDQKMFFDAVKAENYDAIIDMFDRSLGGFQGRDIQAPTIFIDPKSSLVMEGIEAIENRSSLQLAADAIKRFQERGIGVVEDMSKWKVVNRK